MYEDRPEKDTPQLILDELREYGGLSPDGQVIWRIVLAQNCRIHCFGARNHIERGKREAIEQDEARRTDEGLAVKETRLIEPDRIEDGEHWIPRYKFRGWILERWFPASVWGSRHNWESQKARDGRTTLLAAYPQRGSYMMMAGSWPTLLQAGDLKGAIRCYNVQQRSNPVNWGNHIQVMAVFEAQERQQAADAYAEEIAAQHRLGLEHVLRSVSPAAQEFRNVVSKHTAGGVNLGASEKWG
jgi:hypothetical protein